MCVYMPCTDETLILIDYSEGISTAILQTPEDLLAAGISGSVLEVRLCLETGVPVDTRDKVIYEYL